MKNLIETYINIFLENDNAEIKPEIKPFIDFIKDIEKEEKDKKNSNHKKNIKSNNKKEEDINILSNPNDDLLFYRKIKNKKNKSGENQWKLQKQN